MKIRKNQFFQALSLPLFLLVLCQCTTAPHLRAKKPDSDSLAPIKKEPPQTITEPSSSEKLLEKMNQRLLEMENKLSGLNERLEAAQVEIDQLKIQKKFKDVEVLQHPSDNAPLSIRTSKVEEAIDNGFSNDTVVQAFRKSWIVFQARKYADAILSFSDLVERYPDHPLAGAAQYHVAKAYFNQKEYRLAQQEYQRILTSYDTDPYISDTLRDLIFVEEELKNPEKAAWYRQLLASLFPQSDAAWHSTRTAEDTPSAPIETSSPVAVPEPLPIEEKISHTSTPPESTHNPSNQAPPTAPIEILQPSEPATSHTPEPIEPKTESSSQTHHKEVNE